MSAHTSVSRRRLALALPALFLAIAAVFVGSAPAFAHDALVSSDPAADSTVDTLPAEIALTFSADLLSDAGTSVIEVTDSAGTVLSEGSPVVAGNVVTQPLSGTASGTISVVWRVVSSDGPPIDGTFAFTAAAAAATPSEEPSATATSEASAEPEPTMTTISTGVDDEADAAMPQLWPWIIGAVIAVVVIALIVWLLGARARQQKQASAERTAGRRGPSER